MTNAVGRFLGGSPAMVALARRDHPDIRFEVGTMTELDLADGSLIGVIAFW